MQPVLDCFIFDWIEISIQRPWLKQSKSNRVPFNKKRQPPTRFQLLRTQMARRSNKKRSQYQNQPQLAHCFATRILGAFLRGVYIKLQLRPYHRNGDATCQHPTWESSAPNDLTLQQKNQGGKYTASKNTSFINPLQTNSHVIPSSCNCTRLGIAFHWLNNANLSRGH